MTRSKIEQLLGRNMKFSVRHSNIYELIDFSVLNRLINSTTSKSFIRKSWGIQSSKLNKPNSIKEKVLDKLLIKGKDTSEYSYKKKNKLPNDLQYYLKKLVYFK